MIKGLKDCLNNHVNPLIKQIKVQTITVKQNQGSDRLWRKHHGNKKTGCLNGFLASQKALQTALDHRLIG